MEAQNDAHEDAEFMEKIIQEIHAEALEIDEDIPRITPEQEREALKAWAEWNQAHKEASE